MARPTDDLAILLNHPIVLRSAWARVRSWYYSAEVRPEPEYSQWLINADEELVVLGRDLANGVYKPDPFPLVPYPKKGAILRHYALPSVRDQVAFTVVASLLAPIIEVQTPNFVFGNRWFRGIFRRRIGEGSEARGLWARRPFSLADTKMYEPYRRSHGLFRRVCHWTAASMLHTESSALGSFEEPLTPDDYPEELLPPFVKEDWWKQTTSQPERGYWFQADLQLAYPSVRLSYLKEQLRKLVKLDVFGIDQEQSSIFKNSFLPDYSTDGVMKSLEGYPALVASKLITNPALRIQLADKLISWLEQVEYRSYEPESAWIPEHVDMDLPGPQDPEHIGLPTGLGISGMLMNVYLRHFDYKVGNWISKSSRPQAAFVRFADDFILLARDPETLAEGIDTIWHGLAGSNKAVISIPLVENASNLRINWSKVKPESVQKTINEYRRANGWTQCTHCGDLELTKEPSSHQALASWWKKYKGELVDDLNQDALTKSKLGPFVTYLVERLSTMGSDTLFDRFGQRAFDRLVQLHELVRYTLDDGQVKDDTRLAFAANRLATAWLPDESTSAARSSIIDIRMSVQEALRRAPWKFQLWRSIVRCAIRRPPKQEPNTDGWLDDEQAATEWLSRVLAEISASDKMTQSWAYQWPERYKAPKCRSSGDQWKGLYLSFLRSTFWTALADAIRELRRLEERLGTEVQFDTTHSEDRWSSRSWTFRAMSEEQVKPLVDWLSRLDVWARVLYPSRGQIKLSKWELNSLVKAYLACSNQSKLIESINRFPSFELTPQSLRSTSDQVLYLPNDDTLFASLPVLKRLLKVGGVLVSREGQKGDKVFPGWPLLMLTIGNRTGGKRLAKLLSSWSREHRRKALRIGAAMGVSNYLSANVVLNWTNAAVKRVTITKEGETKRLITDMRSLLDYSQARKLATFNMRMAPKLVEVETPTIYRVLWGQAWTNDPFRKWRPKPWVAPAIGLPSPVAMRMFREILSVMKTDKESVSHSLPAFPPIWKIEDAAQTLLEKGRRLQFSSRYADESIDETAQETGQVWVTEGLERTDWEILPHPAFFLPVALGLVRQSNLKYRLWCHLLLFFTAIDGSEKILDSFMEHGLGVIPFSERWQMRTRIHLPASTWEVIDRVRKWFSQEFSWDDSPKKERFPFAFEDANSTSAMIKDLFEELGRWEKKEASLEDFLWERIDVSLQTTDDLEIPRSVRTWKELATKGVQLPIELRPEAPVLEKLRVRVAQVQAEPDWRSYFTRFPRLTRDEIQRIMRQVWASFLSEDYGDNVTRVSQQHNGNGAANNAHQAPSGLIIFPELTLPRSELFSLLGMVSYTGRAALIGSHLHILPTVAVSRRPAPQAVLFVVNEALLAMPIHDVRFSGAPLVRFFWIQKPILSHIELGFQDALNQRHAATGIQFLILPGRRWFRFWHPLWGDYTVSICADLVNPAPWHSMQGQILHLFMCAFNSDVDLFESMTWVRAYENYMNVVSTNHGTYGGSFAWTPKHRWARELARFRGAKIFLTADIELPIAELWHEQMTGLTTARARWRDWWLRLRENPESHTYKSPPPGYNQRNDP